MLTSEAVKKIGDIIAANISEQKPLIIAIDGRCCAGKTALSAELAKTVNCNIFKTDDFYLPPNLRPAQTTTGNMDAQRFLDEVLLPLKAGKEVLYKPFNCKTGNFETPIKIPFKKISVIEGCYSLHPLLRDYYTHAFFITISKEAQQARLKKREGERAAVFNAVWIKKEEEYIAAHAPHNFAKNVWELEGF